ncbi:MAG TPA: type III restriction endonuclease subunit R, partial [Rhodanobacteraceae bacterium]
PAFAKPAEAAVARLAYAAIRKLESRPEQVPSVAALTQPEVLAAITREVRAEYTPAQGELEGMSEKPDIAAVVAKAAELVVQQTIDMPRILVVPKGEVTSGFRPFQLELGALRYAPVAEELWLQYLRTETREVVALAQGGPREARPEDYVVSGLVDFDDVAYDDQADLLYDLAGQVVRHFESYLSAEDAEKVLRCYQKPIAQFVHAQMAQHYYEEASAYEVKVSRGFTELKPSAYTQGVGEEPADYRVAPEDKSNMARYRFGGFTRCLYAVQKFDSDAERKLAMILERDAQKWFKPARGQFQLYYRVEGKDPQEYQPDFVAEAADAIYMLEPKARKELSDPVVLAKQEVAIRWCTRATEYAKAIGGKPWRYALIPHDVIAENMTLVGIAEQFTVR